MRVIGYVRVSTDEQADGGASLGAQADKVASYCRLYGLDLVELVSDPGESGKSLDRPGLKRVLGALASGAADGVVIAKLDRLTRSVADLDGLLRGTFCEGSGKQLFSVGDSIDTRTAAGRLVLNVLMSVAQWEREAIVERTREALAHKRARGERTGGIPYGSDLDQAGPRNADGRPVRLKPNPAESAILARMRAWKASGLSARRIAAELNAAGVLTKTGSGPWRHATVSKILNRTPVNSVGVASQ